MGVQVDVRSIDLTDPQAIQPALTGLLEQGSPPAVLINNAGAAYTGDLLAMPLERWQWLMQLNVTSVMQVCAAVVPAMRATGGLVINVNSHAARNAFPQWGAYCVSKAALASFTRCLAEEERAHGIRACTLTLGAVNTPLWDAETTLPLPWWLAGGISAEWIPELLDRVTPDGLDASSRLEVRPGWKDLEKVNALLTAVQA